MAKQTVSLALAVTAMVFAIFSILLSVVGGPSETTPGSELGFDLRQFEGKLTRLEAQLERVEKEKATTIPIEDDSDVEKPEPVALDTEEEIVGEEEAEADEAEDSLAVRISALQTRIEALESDPIQRGYRYLDSDSVELRKQGILALERIANSDPEALAAIKDMLNDPSEDVRWLSVDTLADLERKESIPLLMGMLDDSSEKVRREAINSLGRLGAADAGPEIAGFLEAENSETRARAADALGRVKFAGAETALLASLADRDSEVRGQAISSLGEIGAKNAVPALRKIYNENPGDQRYRLVNSLKSLGDNEPFNLEFKRLSAQALESEDYNKRTEAIRSLTYFAKTEAKGLVEQLTKDPHKRVRDYASWALRNDRRRR